MKQEKYEKISHDGAFFRYKENGQCLSWVYVCLRCSAIIFNKKEHNIFHDELEDATQDNDSRPIH